MCARYSCLEPTFTRPAPNSSDAPPAMCGTCPRWLEVGLRTYDAINTRFAMQI